MESFHISFHIVSAIATALGITPVNGQNWNTNWSKMPSYWFQQEPPPSGIHILQVGLDVTGSILHVVVIVHAALADAASDPHVGFGNIEQTVDLTDPDLVETVRSIIDYEVRRTLNTTPLFHRLLVKLHSIVIPVPQCLRRLWPKRRPRPTNTGLRI